MLNTIARHIKLIRYFLYFVISLTVVHQFLQGQVVVFWDQFYPLNPRAAFENFSFYWNSTFFPGKIDSSGVNMIPLIASIFVSSLGGKSIVLSQYVIFTSTVFASLVSMHKLISILLGLIFDNYSKLLSEIIGFTGATMYVFNLYVAVYVFRILNTNFILLPALPLSLVLSYKLISRSKFRDLFGFVFINSIILAPVFTNIAFLVPYYLFIILFCLALIVLQKSTHKSDFKSVHKSIGKLTASIVLSLLLSTWWLVPQFIGLSSKFESANKVGGITTLRDNSNKIDFIEVLKLKSFPSLDSDCNTWPTWCNSSQISTSVLSQLYLIPIIAVLILFIVVYFRTRSKDKLYLGLFPKLWFYCTVLITVLFQASLISGLNSTNPLDRILEVIYTKSEMLATAMRDSYHKIGHFYLLSYTLLVAISLAYLLNLAKTYNTEKLKKSSNLLIKSGCVIAILLVFIPSVTVSTLFLSGDVIPKAVAGRPSGRFSVDSNYSRLNSILDTNQIQRIVALPLQGEIVNYNNTSPASVGFDILRNLTFKSVLSTYNDDTNIKSIYDTIRYYDESGQDDKLIFALQKLSIQAIVLPKNEQEFYENSSLLKSKNLGSFKAYNARFSTNTKLEIIEDNPTYIIYQVKDVDPFVNTLNNEDLNFDQKQTTVYPINTSVEEVNSEKSAFSAENMENLRLSDKNFLSVEKSDVSIKKIKLTDNGKLDNPNFKYVNFNGTLDYDDSFLAQNYLAIKFKCFGCYTTLNVEYTLNSSNKKDRYFLPAINPTKDFKSSEYTSEDYYTLYYNLYYPNARLTDLFIHVGRFQNPTVISDVYNLELENISFINKNELPLDTLQGEYCVDIPKNTELSSNTNNVVLFRSININQVNFSKTPYLTLYIKNTADSSAYFHFDGFDSRNQRKALFVEPVYFDKNNVKIENGGYSSVDQWGLIEIDTRQLKLSNVNNLNLHIVSNESSKDKQLCLKGLDANKYSKIPNRLIDQLENLFEQNLVNVAKVTDACKYKKDSYSPSVLVDCVDTPKNLNIAISDASGWVLKNADGTKLSYEKGVHLSGLLSFSNIQNPKSNKFLLEFEPFNKVRYGYLFSLAILIIFALSPLLIHYNKNKFARSKIMKQ